MSHTLAIIKPDAVESGNAGKILAHLETAGFAIRALRLTTLNQAQAGAFYAVHQGRPFYDELVEFMTSGPVVPLVLEAGRVDSLSPESLLEHAPTGDGRALHELTLI